VTPFVARFSRRKLAGKIFWSTILIPAIVLASFRFEGTVGHVLAGVISLFLLWNIARIWPKLSDRQVRLQIDGNGVLAADQSGQVIPWPAISGAQRARYRNEKVIALTLVTPALHPSTLSPMVAGVIKRKFAADRILTDDSLDCTLDDIAPAIRQFRPQVFMPDERLRK
jgi:hypothetical protein